jgi:hypothetical protein
VMSGVVLRSHAHLRHRRAAMAVEVAKEAIESNKPKVRVLCVMCRWRSLTRMSRDHRRSPKT